MIVTTLVLSVTLATLQTQQQCSCPPAGGSSVAAEPVFTFNLVSGTEICACSSRMEKKGSDQFLVRSDGVFTLFKTSQSTPFFESTKGYEYSIDTNENELKISATSHLPFGESWKWVEVPVRRWSISSKDPGSLSYQFILSAPKLSSSQVKEALSFYKYAKKKRINNEEVIGRLFAAALAGNKEAVEALSTMPVDLGIDGYTAEVYHLVVNDYQEYAKQHNLPPMAVHYRK
jgi:hypothetical protein